MDGLAELVEDIGEDRVRRVLVSADARRALREFDRACAIRYALQLLQQRVERPAIRDRLIGRYGFARRTAYRCIDAAIEQFCARTRGQLTHPTATIELPPTEETLDG